jgi:hypothetical protein
VKGIRDLRRVKLNAPIWVFPGDTVSLKYHGPLVGGGGDFEMSTPVVTELHCDEALIFETEAGVLGEGRALGAAFIEKAR